MNTLLIVIIVCVVLGLIAFLLLRKGGKSDSEMMNPSMDGNSQKSITSAKKGDQVRISGMRQMDSVHFSVKNKSRYKQGAHEWFELEGDSSRGDVSLEFSKNGEDANFLSIQDLTLGQLEISLDQLKGMGDSLSGSLSYNGKEFFIKEKGAAEYFEGNGRRSEMFNFYDFRDKDNTEFISVELWDDEVEVFYGYIVDSKFVTIN